MFQKKNKSNNIEIKTASKDKYFFKLFVSTNSILATKSIINIKSFLEQYLKGRYELEIIDIFQNPEILIKEEIITVPLLIKESPLPKIRIVGEMTDTEKIKRELLIY